MSYTNKFYNIDPIPDNIIQERLRAPMSDGDVEKYSGGASSRDIIKYSDLENYETIDDLLPNPFDYRIILIETRENLGHWVLLLKHNNSYEYFNSYGVNADSQKNRLNKMMNRMLGQKEDFVMKLIKASKKKYVINNVPFQNRNPQIATCGRWCVLRILTAEKMGMSLTEFTAYILKNCDKLKISPDMLVCMFIV